MNDIDVQYIKTSLKYAKDREYQLYGNVQRLKSYEGLQKVLPPFVNTQLDVPLQINFGLTYLCLPQTDTYDAMPKHKWRKIREALEEVANENDIKQLVDYCDQRYLYFGWEYMREAFMILGRPQFRKLLWKLEGPKVAEIENFPLIMEVLEKGERQDLKETFWSVTE